MNLVRFAHNWNTGILEYWNDGIMGFGQMEYWDMDNVPLDSEVDK